MGGKRPDQFNIDPAEGSSTNHTWRGEGRSGDERIDTEDKRHLQENPHDQPMIPKPGTDPASRDVRSRKATGTKREEPSDEREPSDDQRGVMSDDERLDESLKESFPASDPASQP